MQNISYIKISVYHTHIVPISAKFPFPPPRPPDACPTPRHRQLPSPAGRRHRHCHLVAPPFLPLVVPACCQLPHCLSSSSCCTAHSSSHRAGWLFRRLSARRPLVISPSLRAASRCLIASAGCCIITSHRPLVVPPSRPLSVLAGCCVASPCATLSSFCRSPLPTPLNAVERCCRH